MAFFSVTYEIWSVEAIEAGETDDRGFVSEHVSLRDAIEEVGGRVDEANEWPVRSPRWFTNYAFDANPFTGETEQRSLHIPENVTPASRRRLARLLGVKV